MPCGNCQSHKQDIENDTYDRVCQTGYSDCRAPVHKCDRHSTSGPARLGTLQQIDFRRVDNVIPHNKKCLSQELSSMVNRLLVFAATVRWQ
jgi:hypothetical protein